MSLSPQDVDFDALWVNLKDGVRKVITLEGTSGMPMYEDVYKLCTAPQGYQERLYYALKRFLELHVEALFKGMAEKQSDLLTEYLKRWNEYDTGCTATNRLFNYLNNHWIKKQMEDSRQKLSGHVLFSSSNAREVHYVYTLALITWKIHVFDKLKDRINRDILGLITQDREGDRVEQALLIGVILSYVKLGSIKPNKALKIYKEDFEEPYLKATQEYYTIESSNFIAQSGISEYMKRAEVRIAEEESRAKKILDPSSFEKVVNTLNDVLITNHKEIMQIECEEMLRQDRRQDLKRMYHLLNRIEGGVQPMLYVLEKYITAVGMEAIKSLNESGQLTDNGERDEDFPDQAKGPATGGRGRGQPRGRGRGRPPAGRGGPPAPTGSSEEAGEDGPGKETETAKPTSTPSDPSEVYVETLLKLHNQFAEVIETAFSNDSYFISALYKACRSVVNENCVSKDTTKSPELLARYTDLLLKKSNKHLDENEIDKKLAQIVLIFKYVDDKDVFQKFYAKYLTKRLIHGTSISDDAEKVMINGLRDACGFEYTAKLQRMFNDIGLSVEVNDKFRDYMSEQRVNLGLDFNIMVLTSGSWPLFGQRSNFNVPPLLQTCIQEFQKFYLQINNGRRLNWLHHMCKGDLKMMYTKTKYEFQATNFQLGVLLLFNQAEQLSESDLQTSTSLQEGELKRTLRSLLDCRILTLVKPPEDGEETGHIYTLNPKFHSKRVKFKITSALQAATPVENAQTRKTVQDDRKIFLQAAIVRIMKARKRLKHNELIQEVIQQSRARFQPHIPMIKRCVEQLIEKEYLERTENDEYSYVA